jgi:hypothetical protein
MAAAVVILVFLALFAAGGSGRPSASGGFPTTTTTTPKSSPTTSTTIVTLRGTPGRSTQYVAVPVTVPNVLGMTLAHAGSALSSVRLGYDVSSGSTQPSGTSATGTVVAQTPDPGFQAQTGLNIHLTVSGY